MLTKRTLSPGVLSRRIITLPLVACLLSPAAAQTVATPSGATSSEQQQEARGRTMAPNGSTNISAPASPDLRISQSGGQVQTVDLGDVTGTVCDCGEIPIPAEPIPEVGLFRRIFLRQKGKKSKKKP
ncbi:MAG TPA: hypothetical protein VN282_21965 [Pyrinomonadaceae bacterium]|nr:hypothetical protein [Pyrinomonadaceae bacterium]